MEKAIGIVLDISLSHESDGRRRLDKVKEELVKYIKESVVDGEDVFYLYHPEIIESMIKNGEKVSSVSNYETDGWQFDLNYALKQTLYVIGAEDPDADRMVILITDRLEEIAPLKKFVTINKKDDYDCDLLVIPIGDRCDGDAIMAGFDYTWVNPLEDSLSLACALNEVTNGRESHL
jgi:hypothetical protein